MKTDAEQGINPLVSPYNSPQTFVWARVENEAGCYAVSAVRLVIQQNPGVTLTPQSSACAGANNGSVLATMYAGSANYTYAWSNGITEGPTALAVSTLDSLSAGQYTVTVTDANGCTVATTTAVEDGLYFAMSPINDLSMACPGTLTAPVALATNLSGAVFHWTGGALAGLPDGSATSLNSVIPAFTTLNSNNTVTVTATLGACSTSEIFAINAQDTEKPVFTTGLLPTADLILHCGDEVPVAPVVTINDVHDNCTAPADLTLQYEETNSRNNDPLTCGYYTYDITRTWKLHDHADNEQVNVQHISVSDVTAPTAICKNMHLELGENGTATILPKEFDNGSTDNCANANALSFSASATNFTVQSPASTEVVLTVSDPCGNSSTCLALVTIGSLCDQSQNDAQLWNAPYWYDSVMSQNDLNESPADLMFLAKDSCINSTVQVNYRLFLDLDGNGIPETVVNSQQPPETNTVYYGNALNPNYSGGEPRAFDQRNVPVNQQYRFTVEQVVVGQTIKAHVRWTTAANPTTYVVPQLPHGTHRIQWYLTDACGNNVEDDYRFQLYDCQQPVIACRGGITADIKPNDKVTVTAQQLVLTADDNATPDAKLVYATRRAGQGTGLPINTDGTLETSLTFTCAELGNHAVELWVMDRAGNMTSCETTVKVRDLYGYCGQGTVATTEVTPKGDVSQELTHNPNDPNAVAPTETVKKDPFVLYQNEPNPFLDKTTIGFYLPAPTTATLSVYDETGRVVYTTKGSFAKGRNAFQIDLAPVISEGMLYYRISTPTDSAVRKMVQVKD